MSTPPSSSAPAIMVASRAGEDSVGGGPPTQSAAGAQDETGSDPPASTGGRGRFSREQIEAILNEQASGTPIVQLCRIHGISTTTFFRWRKRYEGEAPAPRAEHSKIRHLEEENRHLKTLLAEAVLENAIIREGAGLGSLFGKK